ncbi:FadR/GntR family transcriptional regulator [soil metagenome]
MVNVASSTSPSQPGSLRPMPRQRLYLQLVEKLMAFIDAEGLRTGDRLPPERELAARLAVSRASVSQALVALEVQGIVEVRHGDGAVLAQRPLSTQVVATLRSRRRRLPEIIEARYALEVKLAELAAQRRTADDLVRIDAALLQMADEIADGARGAAGDETFHVAVTRAGHSGLLADLMAEIAPAVLESRIESLSQPGRPQAFLEGHRAIAEAIRAGDAAGAAAAMRDHLDIVSDVALLRGDPDLHR